MNGIARLLVASIVGLPPLLNGMNAAGASAVDDYPSRPLRAIVPNAPGGGSDISGRIVASALGEALGQQVVVDNRPGAGGTMGVSTAARAQPDGYTLLMGNISTHGINVAVFKSLPYDPVKDFAPVSMLGTTPNVLVVHPAVPARTFKEFIAYAKGNPGTIRYGSSGTGGSPHLAMELLKSLTGTDMLHVPYKGSGPVTIDLMSGQIHTTSASVSSQLPYIKSGKVRALAVTSAKRSAQLPDVPTVIESGVPGYEVTIWYGLFVPAGVPQRIIARLNSELVKVLATPILQQRMGSAGIDASASTPAELGAFVKAEIAKWTKVVKIAGITPQ
jgi:tripartite-type tricarboxylate transporter receptor subunit TctC